MSEKGEQSTQTGAFGPSSECASGQHVCDLREGTPAKPDILTAVPLATHLAAAKLCTDQRGDPPSRQILARNFRRFRQTATCLECEPNTRDSSRTLDHSALAWRTRASVTLGSAFVSRIATTSKKTITDTAAHRNGVETRGPNSTGQQGQWSTAAWTTLQINRQSHTQANLDYLHVTLAGRTGTCMTGLATCVVAAAKLTGTCRLARIKPSSSRRRINRSLSACCLTSVPTAVARLLHLDSTWSTRPLVAFLLAFVGTTAKGLRTRLPTRWLRVLGAAPNLPDDLA